MSQELKVKMIVNGEGSAIKFYYAQDVDDTLAEKDKEIEQLQAMLEERNSQIAKLTENTRKLKMTLWLTREAFCGRSVEWLSGITNHCLVTQFDLYKECEKRKQKYLELSYKCRARAMRFKDGK